MDKTDPSQEKPKDKEKEKKDKNLQREICQFYVQFGEKPKDSAKTKVELAFHMSKEQSVKLSSNIKSKSPAFVGEDTFVLVLNIDKKNETTVRNLVIAAVNGTSDAPSAFQDFKLAEKLGLTVNSATVPAEGDRIDLYFEFNPSGNYKQMADGFSRVFMDLGGKEIVDTQDNWTRLLVEGDNSLEDIDKTVKEGETLASALLRDLRFEFDFSLDPNFLSKFTEILGNIEPSILNSYVGLLPYFQDLDIKLKFRNSEEIPLAWRKHWYLEKYQKSILELSTSLEKDMAKFIEELGSRVGEVRVLSALKGFATIELKFKAPGFLNHVMKGYREHQASGK